jgi:hypothetical protein
MPGHTVQRAHYHDRRYRRLESTIPAQIFRPDTDEVVRCAIANLSAGGAGIACASRLPLGARIVLYIDGFGRFEAVVVRHADGILGVAFVCGALKRERLARGIAEYELTGTKSPTSLRRQPRRPLLENGYFLRPDGKKVRYDAVDVSMHGISVITDERPPVGEILNLGKCFGRVSRHHQLGIAIEFVDSQNPPPVLKS